MSYLLVSNNIQQADDVRSTREVLQDLDLPLYLLLLHRLEHLDNALVVVDNVDAFEDFRILSSSCAWSSVSACM